MELIFKPFEWALQGLNWLLTLAGIGNYALSILVFTILVNVAMIPLNIKQQKSMAGQARLRPKLDALKEKYGDDKMKYNTAMQELYQREDVKMMGGCLPMLLRMIFLMGVYSAIRMMVYTADGQLKTGMPEFNLFGLDLAEQPQFSTNIIGDFQMIWIIPVLSFLTSLFTAIISTMQQKHTNPQAAQAGGSMKAMMLIMPIFSLVIAFGVPGAVGFYWCCSNLVNTLITVIVNQFYSVNKVVALDTLKKGTKRRTQEALKIQKAGAGQNTAR